MANFSYTYTIKVTTALKVFTTNVIVDNNSLKEYKILDEISDNPSSDEVLQAWSRRYGEDLLNTGIAQLLLGDGTIVLLMGETLNNSIFEFFIVG